MEHSENTLVYVYDMCMDLLKTLCQVKKKKNQTQRPHIVRYNLYKMFTIGESIETESRLVVFRAWGQREVETDC